MPDGDAIERRLAVVERALTDGREDVTDLGDEAALAARLDEVEATAARLERRVDDLDAAVQALRGYVGNVRHVNRDVERRADAALATARRAAGAGAGGDRQAVDSGAKEPNARGDREANDPPGSAPTRG